MEKNVKLAQAWYSVTARGSPRVIQNSSAGSKRHHSASHPGVTPNSSTSETFYCKYSIKFNKKKIQ